MKGVIGSRSCTQVIQVKSSYKMSSNDREFCHTVPVKNVLCYYHIYQCHTFDLYIYIYICAPDNNFVGYKHTPFP